MVCILADDEQQGRIRALERGWLKASPDHRKSPPFMHPVKPGITTVPHPRRNIPIGTLRSIERQSDVK
jgi:predicted RNA binding protein YcfA (HicA-like mRNA interferase family)